MKLAEVIAYLDRLAPPHLAEAWDNVGLLVGDPAADVSRAMLCIDYTAAVADEAKATGVDFVLAYHPPIFDPLKRVTADCVSALVYDAARRGTAIYSPHTALDVAEGGTNDVLADILDLAARRPLRISPATAGDCKLVTFVPATHVDAVADALFAAGAGRIGDYSRCSFRTNGVGTFFGEAGASPAVGEAGKFETAAEVKIETVLPLAKVGDVVAALRAAHPYETPAFDLVTLAAPPSGTGIGRVGRLSPPVERAELFARIKIGLSIDQLLIAGPKDGTAASAAVCAGSGGDLLGEALAAGVDLFLTGELRHHDALRAAAAGMTVVSTLHSRSERVTLHRLAPKLSADLPGVAWDVSGLDADPFSVR